MEPHRSHRKRLGMRLYVILEKGSGLRRSARRTSCLHPRSRKARLLFSPSLEVDENDQSQGSGIMVILAASIEAAKAIDDAEPFHRQGYRRYEIRRWRVSEGSFRLNLHCRNRYLISDKPQLVRKFSALFSAILTPTMTLPQRVECRFEARNISIWRRSVMSGLSGSAVVTRTFRESTLMTHE
jgi:hypothetical protein